MYPSDISRICNMCALASVMLHLQFVRAHIPAQSRIYTGPLRLYLQFAYVESIYWQSSEDVRERERARAHAYTYACAARELPAYFGILIARGRPSPLPHPVPPPLFTPSRPTSYPTAPLHPDSTLWNTRRRVLVFPPRDVTHPENLRGNLQSHTYAFSRMAIITYVACLARTCIFCRSFLYLRLNFFDEPEIS